MKLVWPTIVYPRYGQTIGNWYMMLYYNARRGDAYAKNHWWAAAHSAVGPWNKGTYLCNRVTVHPLWVRCPIRGHWPPKWLEDIRLKYETGKSVLEFYRESYDY